MCFTSRAKSAYEQEKEEEKADQDTRKAEADRKAEAKRKAEAERQAAQQAKSMTDLEMLGLEQGSSPSQDEIRRAYKQKCLQEHPDKVQQRGCTQEELETATVRFRQIHAAYERLHPN